MAVPVIDVHTHMLSDGFLNVLKKHGGPMFTVKDVNTLKGVRPAIHRNGSMFMTIFDEMLNYDLRIADMDKAKVDMSIISLTCPNVYWGDAGVSVETAKMMNDSMAFHQSKHPDRFRFFCSLPWLYPDLAVQELKRAVNLGAVGVMVIANVDEKHLTDPLFESIWKAIDDIALPVLIHPSLPPGSDSLKLDEFHLAASNGFIIDTTLAISRMIMNGFFDTFPNLKIISCHGGGAIPYVIGRLDQVWANVPAAREKISRPPSSYMPQIYADSVLYRLNALNLCMAEFGDDNVLFGSDYPHNIGDMAGCLSRVDALSAGARDKVRSKNALKLFNL